MFTYSNTKQKMSSMRYANAFHCVDCNNNKRLSFRSEFEFS